MIVAREEGEVKFLEGYRNQYANLYPTSCNGPLALIDGEPNQEDLQINFCFGFWQVLGT
jgi:hypothetical protein